MGSLRASAGDVSSPLVREDPTCLGDLSQRATLTDPALELGAATTEGQAPQSLCSTRKATATRSPCATAREQAVLAAAREKPKQREDPGQPKINKIIRKEIKMVNFPSCRFYHN